MQLIAAGGRQATPPDASIYIYTIDMSHTQSRWLVQSDASDFELYEVVQTVRTYACSPTQDPLTGGSVLILTEGVGRELLQLILYVKLMFYSYSAYDMVCGINTYSLARGKLSVGRMANKYLTEPLTCGAQRIWKAVHSTFGRLF
jgi:hypothetical protein